MRRVDSELLRTFPLPDPGDAKSKFDRGNVLLIGGSAETPGALLLAGIASLRVGAGRVHLATVAAAAPGLAIAFPEARVTGLSEQDNMLSATCCPELLDALDGADAIAIGSGCRDAVATGSLVRALLPHLPTATALVLDAAALPVLAEDPGLLRPFGERALLLPNPGEMAKLLERPLDAVLHDPEGALRAAIDRFGVCVALRGPETWIGSPDVGLFVERSGPSALATSGSGDVLAGAVAGLAASGAGSMSALLWGVHTHRRAGTRLAANAHGPGLLARELLDVLALELNDIRGDATSGS